MSDSAGAESGPVVPPVFRRYIGIDYSGAATPVSGLTRLRVFSAAPSSSPVEVASPGPRKRWTRRGLAEWLAAELSDGAPTVAGIDHGFSFPPKYFETHRLPLDWPAFLDDFRGHWPTDDDETSVQSVRDGVRGSGAARGGDRRWRRLTEIRAAATKSVFFFDVHGSVAKSTHAGLPWLRYVRGEAGDRVHFWPFDGWEVPAGGSVVAEVYPSLWSPTYPREGRTGDQHDAYSVAAWMREADRDGRLAGFWEPSLTDDERRVARIEGWILGIR